MKTKYFRFLFCGNKSCLVHFGELTDTCTEERFTFLYLYGSEKRGAGRDSGKVLFLCPKHVNLVVAGNANEQTDGGLGEILSGTQADLVILPESDYSWKTELGSVGKVRYLRGKQAGCSREQKESKALCDVEEILAAGWKFFVKSYEPGSIVMAHGLAGRKSKEEGKIKGDECLAASFEDCLMNVKVLDGEERCLREEAPDSYGCALGCTLRRDYDICKYQRTGKEGIYLTGTLLCGGRLGKVGLEELKRDLDNEMDAMRFFALPGLEHIGLPREEKRNFKSYCIGLENEAGEKEVAGVCRKSLYQTPVLLKDGEGICCSGLLKYSE